MSSCCLRALSTLWIIGQLFSGAGLGGQESPTVKRAPNLIIVLTDDQGYGDVGFNGCQDIATPNLDALAAGGARFTNGYVSFPVCGPSRAGLMTGRYQDRFGFTTNPTIDPGNANAGIPLQEHTLAETLDKAGYATMAIGKWHLGTHPTLQPLKRGFDEFFGFLSGGHRYFPEELTLNDLSECKQTYDWYRTRLLRNDQRVDITNYLTDELSDAAVDFIERKKDEPFFLYLAYNAPHGPLQASPKYLDRFPQIADKKRRTYAAMVSAVDDGVGRILAKLDEHRLNEQTLVVFLSDNGGPEEVNGSDNGPLRGGKGTPFEGGLRVPFAMRWTGTIPAGLKYESPVISLDIFATIAAEAGVDVPTDRPLDGVNLIPYLTGGRTDPPHQQLHWRLYRNQTLVVRRGNDKLIRQKPGEETLLFDLGSDLQETKNVAADQTSIVRELNAEIDQWAAQLQEPAFPALGTWLKK